MVSMCRLRFYVGLAFWPMRPDEVTDNQCEPYTDHDIELMEVLPQLIPPFTHFHTDIGQTKTPGDRSYEGEQYESPERHPCNSRRKGNKGPDHGQQAAEKYCGFSIFLKPAISDIDVSLGH